MQLQDDDEVAGGAHGGGGDHDEAFAGLGGTVGASAGAGGAAQDGGAARTDPVFWPRQVYGPEDLRNANITIAALCFEESCESAYFEPCVPANLDKVSWCGNFE